MSAENLCAGCSACCRRMFLRVSTEERRQSFPNLEQVDYYCDSTIVPFCTSLSETMDLIYSGPACPNLDENGSCTIYNDRPEACRNFELNGPDCVKLRSRILEAR